ncbi:MAG TPA: hypothetical protein DCK95_08560, partial [Anaerolineaceae bacterium]|nr:hypothetical protein [Anaerolineaceae bacterium]
MKVFSRYLLIITLVFSLFACTAKENIPSSTTIANDDQLALNALVDFLESLHAGKYDEAAQFYGGTYEIMINHNPDIAPQDHAALLRNACTINGAQCLQVRSTGLEEKISDTEFTFKVEFQNADGSLFVIGSCCGEEETEALYHSIFSFRVSKNAEGNFQVMDMVP